MINKTCFFLFFRMNPETVWQWIQSAGPDEPMPVLTLQDVIECPESESMIADPSPEVMSAAEK